ncbi:unnamed protein product [Mucor hiemalis]
MRFSSTSTTATATPTGFPMITTIHQVTPNMSNIKKVFTTLVSKLPHHHGSNHKVSPTTSNVVKNNSRTYIKVVPKKSASATTTAVKKDNDMNRDIRNYYAQQQSRKRQLEDVYNKKVELEREIRHKTVKQYQQPEQRESCHYHFKEHSTITINNNKSAQQPKWTNTHGYLRDTRTNSDYLRRLALTNSSKIATKQKPYLKKRSDEFVWGQNSPLRNSITPM